MIDFDAGMLDLVCHRVQQVLPLCRVRDQSLNVSQPQAGIAAHAVRAGVTPLVPVDLPDVLAQDRAPRCVGDALQHPPPHRRAVFIV